MKIEIKYAFIYVAVSFVWNCVEYMTGLQKQYIHLHPYFVTPFFIILTVIIYYWALNGKRAKFYGKLTFSRAFFTGFLLTVFILIFNPLFLYIFYLYVNPDFLNSFILHDISAGSKTPAEANQYYTIDNFIVRGSVYRAVMGLAATVLIFLFMKKDTRRY
jgi:hypothetical protein